MVTHSRILAWEIPWTEEPGGLQSMGLQRVGHNWARMHTHWIWIIKIPNIPSKYLNIKALRCTLFLECMPRLAIYILQFSSIQLLSRVRLFATPWIAARQASLSITNSWSSLRLTSSESVMPSSHLIFCHPLLLPPIPPSIRVFSNESTLRMRWPKYIFTEFRQCSGF